MKTKKSALDLVDLEPRGKAICPLHISLGVVGVELPEGDDGEFIIVVDSLVDFMSVPGTNFPAFLVCHQLGLVLSDFVEVLEVGPVPLSQHEGREGDVGRVLLHLLGAVYPHSPLCLSDLPPM